MSSNSRVTRSKCKSDKISLPVRTRQRSKPTNMENDDGNTALNTTFDTGSDQHHPQMPVHMSCTKCEMHAVVAMCSTLVLLLTRCPRAPTKRHSSPVEAVLTGSGVALLGLIEIPKSPMGHGTID